MTDIFLESIRAIVVTLTFVYLWVNGRKAGISSQKGWSWLLSGFALVLFGMLIDITDNFQQLDKFIVIGDTAYQSFLEKVVGYLAGFMLIAVGFWKWLPTVIQLRETRNELADSHRELEQEIRDRTQVEESLRREKAKLETVTRNMGVGLVVISRDHRILWSNRVIRELDGNIDALCPKPFVDAIFTKARELVTHEQMIQDTGGNTSWYQIIATPIKDPNGAVTSALEVIVPVTERKMLEAQLLQARKMESMGTIAGGIAHDFNNILGIIIGNTELALDDIQEQVSVRPHLGEILEAGLRAKEVVRHLLSFSHRREPRQERMEIRPLVKEAARVLRPSAPSAIEIRLHLPDELPAIKGDPAQISRLLTHLCTNAFHSMEEKGGIVKITAEVIDLEGTGTPQYIELGSGTHLQLSVSDTGHGIDPEITGRIFDPYFTTKEVGKGSGMGLAIVHGIVRNHGGAVSVHSVPGKGTTVNILFPVAERKLPKENASTGLLPKGHGEILFVDDEPSLARLGKTMLENLGYKVETETDPAEALELFRADPGRFDLIITDMTMPRMTGDELVEKILQIRKGMPIILCTGYSERIDRETAEKIGIRRYMEKPLNMRELAQGVRELLEPQEDKGLDQGRHRSAYSSRFGTDLR